MLSKSTPAWSCLCQCTVPGPSERRESGEQQAYDVDVRPFLLWPLIQEINELQQRCGETVQKHRL